MSPEVPAVDTGADLGHLTPHGVRVWYTDVQAEAGRLPEELLSAEERGRAGKYRFEEDRRRFIVARCMLRLVLSSCAGRDPRAIVFEPGPNGKPRLKDEPPAGLQFNVSHSGDIVVVAVARGRDVGVDVEIMRCPVPGMDAVRHYLSAREQAVIDALAGPAQARAFYRLWSRKEALLKATGEGLGGLDRSLDLSSGSDFRRRGTAWYVADLDLQPAYVAALAVEGGAGAIKISEWRLPYHQAKAYETNV
jgi:4'-phosphopantetheinyl transferase